MGTCHPTVKLSTFDPADLVQNLFPAYFCGRASPDGRCRWPGPVRYGVSNGEGFQPSQLPLPSPSSMNTANPRSPTNPRPPCLSPSPSPRMLQGSLIRGSVLNPVRTLKPGVRFLHGLITALDHLPHPQRMPLYLSARRFQYYLSKLPGRFPDLTPGDSDVNQNSCTIFIQARQCHWQRGGIKLKPYEKITLAASTAV